MRTAARRTVAIAAAAATAAVGATAARPGAAGAAGFAVAEQSAVAGGTAAAGTARDGDPSAAWYNPAALADDGGWRVGLGLLAARPSLTARAQDGSWETGNDAAWSTPPHLAASWARRDLAVGVFIGVPYGSGVTWPGDWPGRHEITRTRLEDLRVAPFVAWRSGRLRVAGGLHLDAAHLRVERRLDFIDMEGDVTIDLRGVGVGFDAALFWEATPRLDVGLSYKSRTTIPLSGEADFTAPDAFAGKTPDQRASSELTTPDRIALGVKWRRGRFAVLADLELTFWGVHDELVVDFEHEATPDATQRYDWSHTLAGRAGAEWAFRPGWVGRGGAFFDPSPASAEALAPSSPDSSRVGLTLGVSRSLGAWSVDAFYEYLALLERTSENQEALEASYGGHAHLVGVGVRYQR